jgi:streptogramin lyase
VPTTISIANASLNEIGTPSAFVTAGSGGLSGPEDITIGPDGNLYVVTLSSTVLRYNSGTGQFISTFVSQGSGGLSVSDPAGLAFGPDGNLYVASRGTNQVLSYNGTTGAFISAFVSAGLGGLSGPTGITFGADGNLYVGSFNNNEIMRYNGPLAADPGTADPASGQSGATFVASSSGGVFQPYHAIFSPDGNLYVTGEQTDGVLRYNGTTGAFINTFVPDTLGKVLGRSMAFDQEGRLYVADFSGDVHRYDSQGNSLGDLLVDTVNQVTLNKPKGMAFDGQGNLFIGCRDNNTIVRLDRGVVVSLSAASSTPVTVNYTTADGSALAGTDYFALSGTVTFNPGQTSREILLATQETAALDGNDNFSVQLSNPTGGATIATGSATVTIVDPTRSFSISDASAIEGDHTAHYRGAFVNLFPGWSQSNVAFGPDGNLYTDSAYSGGHGIDRYNVTTGAFIDHFVPDGVAPLYGARDFVFHNGYLDVACEYSNEVLRFDATTGAFLSTLVAPGGGGLNAPKGMAVGPDGNLYVSNIGSNNILRFDGTTGASLGVFVTAGSGGLSGPQDLIFDSSGTYLYVASSGSNQILKYNAQTGAFVGVAASAGLSNPQSVKFGPDGLMYVGSFGNNRILRFTANGTYVDDYVPAGSGGMAGPMRMAFGPDGDLYVTATGPKPVYNHQILRFGTENEALFTITNTTASTLPLTVNYATADGTAIAGTNYTATPGTFTFNPGVTSDTIRVPILDSGSQTSPLSFTLTLSNPEAATLSRSQATGTIQPSDQAAKFYVVNDSTPSLGGTNTDYKYQSSGTQQAPYGLNLNDLDPRGIASNAAGTTQWVVDANKNVYVYSPSGTLLGSWSAGGLSSSATLTGIATNGTDIWLLDSYSSKVYKYNGAASLRSGSQNANSSFRLSRSNSNATDMVTDGTYFWVVNANGSSSQVFKYSLSGRSLGSWTIDPANTNPTGITINPNSVSDVWIVDNGTNKVYDYTAAASRTSGSQNAASTFALAANNTNPQGLADPPALAPFPTALPVSTVLNAQPPGRESAVARIPSLAGEDVMWATLSGESLRTANEPIQSFTGVDSAVTSRGVPGERSPSTPRTSLAPIGVEGAGSDSGAAELLEDALAPDDSQASATAMDAFFAMLVDRPITD